MQDAFLRIDTAAKNEQPPPKDAFIAHFLGKH
jgi:hypothetical protein